MPLNNGSKSIEPNTKFARNCPFCAEMKSNRILCNIGEDFSLGLATKRDIAFIAIWIAIEFIRITGKSWYDFYANCHLGSAVVLSYTWHELFRPPLQFSIRFPTLTRSVRWAKPKPYQWSDPIVFYRWQSRWVTRYESSVRFIGQTDDNRLIFA